MKSPLSIIIPDNIKVLFIILKDDILWFKNNTINISYFVDYHKPLINEEKEKKNDNSDFIINEKIKDNIENLLIFNKKEEIIKSINEKQVTIISGDKGCGKSTQISQYILENSLKNNKECNIYEIEPFDNNISFLAKKVY